MEKTGFEPVMVFPIDLQSTTLNHSVTSPRISTIQPIMRIIADNNYKNHVIKNSKKRFGWLKTYSKTQEE